MESWFQGKSETKMDDKWGTPIDGRPHMVVSWWWPCIFQEWMEKWTEKMEWDNGGGTNNGYLPNL